MATDESIRLWIDAVLIWGPIVGGVALVAHVWRRRLREGLSPRELALDREALIGFFYTGALLAIYLSCFHFFYYRTRGLPPAFAADQKGVLVADLPEDAEHYVQRALAEAIRHADPSLVVRLIERRFPDDVEVQQEQAQRLGAILRARVVVTGATDGRRWRLRAHVVGHREAARRNSLLGREPAPGEVRAVALVVADLARTL